MSRQPRIHRAPSGHRCGESHPRAKLSDDDVRLIRALHADKTSGLGYGQIAEKFDCPKSTVRNICTYVSRF